MHQQISNYEKARLGGKAAWFGYLVCTIGAIFYCYEFVLRILPGALQSEISSAFGHISASTFGQLSAFYYFAYSPMQLPVGMLMDRFGPRKLLFFACLCCTAGSFMFSFSESILIACSGRFLVGFGSSFAFVGVLSLALYWLPRRFFSLAVGLITTLGMLGLVYGEIKITKTALSVGLYPVLFSMVIFGSVLSVLILLIVKDGPGSSRLKKLPLQDFFRDVGRVLTSAEVWMIGLVAACLYTSLSVFGELWGKAYLEQAHHLTKMQAAHAISALFLGWAVGAPVSGFISDITGRRVLCLVIGAIGSLCTISIILYVPMLSFAMIYGLLFIYGVFSGTEIVAFVMAKENSGAKLSGTVFAVTNMIVTLGGVFFQPLVGKLLDLFGEKIFINGEYVYSTLEYQVALSLLPLSLLLVLVFAFFLKDNPVSEK